MSWFASVLHSLNLQRLVPPRNQLAKQCLVATPGRATAVRGNHDRSEVKDQWWLRHLAFAGIRRIFNPQHTAQGTIPRPVQRLAYIQDRADTAQADTARRTLVTVSTVIDDDVETQVAQQMRPRVDYLEMARTFHADLIDYAEARRIGGWFGRWLEKIGGANLTLAWASFLQRNNYEVIFTDGEQIGIPLAWFCCIGGTRGVRHVMITHILSVYKKMFFFDLFRLQRYIDTFLVYSTWQKRFIEQRWQVQPERVAYTPFMVDTKFFSPTQVIPNPRRMISSAGLECRDYPTLVKVAFHLDVQVVIAAGSPFSKRRDTTENLALPPNVSINRLTQYELRQLYADSLFVVVPLYNVEFQAGVTVILEAMAMEKAVICSGTPGQTDVVIEGETGLYVPAEDQNALHAAIAYLLAHPEEAARMGKAGRQLVEERMSLDCYTERLNGYVQAALTKATVRSGLSAQHDANGRFPFEQPFDKNVEDLRS